MVIYVSMVGLPHCMSTEMYVITIELAWHSEYHHDRAGLARDPECQNVMTIGLSALQGMSLETYVNMALLVAKVWV